MDRLTIGPKHVEFIVSNVYESHQLTKDGPHFEKVAAWLKDNYAGYLQLRNRMVADFVKGHGSLDNPTDLSGIRFTTRRFSRGGYLANAENDIEGHEYRGAQISFLSHDEKLAMAGVKEQAGRAWHT